MVTCKIQPVGGPTILLRMPRADAGGRCDRPSVSEKHETHVWFCAHASDCRRDLGPLGVLARSTAPPAVCTPHGEPGDVGARPFYSGELLLPTRMDQDPPPRPTCRAGTPSPQHPLAVPTLSASVETAFAHPPLKEREGGQDTLPGDLTRGFSCPGRSASPRLSRPEQEGEGGVPGLRTLSLTSLSNETQLTFPVW